MIPNFSKGNVGLKYESTGDHQFKQNQISDNSLLTFLNVIGLMYNSYNVFSVVIRMLVHLY